MNPSKENLERLGDEDTGLPPGFNLGKGKSAKLIGNVMAKAKKGLSNSKDPNEAMKSILESGALSELMNGIKEGKESGELDMKDMAGTLMGAMQSMMSAGGKKAKKAKKKAKKKAVEALKNE